MALFEFLAFWRDGVTAKELGQTLAMSREAAQRSVVGPYKREFPNNSMILHQGRTHVEGDAYALKASPYRPLDVANFTSAIDAFALAMSTQSPLGVPIEDVASPIESAEEVSGLRALYGDGPPAGSLLGLPCQTHPVGVQPPHDGQDAMPSAFTFGDIRSEFRGTRAATLMWCQDESSEVRRARRASTSARRYEWHQRTRIFAELVASPKM